MKEAYIIDAVRTPIGKFGGALSTIRPDDLAAIVIRALMERNKEIDPKQIEDVIFGAANQAGEDNRNVARMALLLAGLPIEVGGLTVNRLCASGLQAIMDASRSLKLDEGSIYIAGGSESMSRAPFVMPKSYAAFSRSPEVYDTTIGWRFPNPVLSKLYPPISMGETAENVAAKWKISRAEQDAFSHNSQLKYQQAHDANKFKEELVPVTIQPRKGDPYQVITDEHPRLSSEEKLNSLKAAFQSGGSVTAGNSSGINDGSSALLLVNEEVVKTLQLKPLAKVISMAVAGVDPNCMGIGPVPATKKSAQKSRSEDIRYRTG